MPAFKMPTLLTKRNKNMGTYSKPLRVRCTWTLANCESVNLYRNWSQLRREATVGEKHVHGDSSIRTITALRGTTKSYTLSRLKREAPQLCISA